MKCNPIATVLTNLVAMSLLALASCSHNKDAAKAVEAESAKAPPPPPAIAPAIVSTSEATGSATITAIDPATRTVTLKNTAGEIHRYQCGPAVRNFDQLRVGDTVNATIVQQLRIYVRKGGAPPSMAAGGTISRAPKGDKPAATVSETIQRTATILAVDPDRNFVTVKNAEGETKTYAVDPGIDLSGVHVGDDVVTQLYRGLSIVVESKPAP